MRSAITSILHKISITDITIVCNSALMVFAFYPLLHLLFFESLGLLKSYAAAGIIILAVVTVVHHFFHLPEPKFISLLPFVVMYLLGLVLGEPLLYRTMFFLSAADLWMLFIYRYYHGFDEFLMNNHTISDMPVSYMRKVHHRFFLLAFFLVLASMIPAFAMKGEPLASYFEQTNQKQEQAVVSEEEQLARWEEEANFTVSDSGYSEYFDELIHIPKWLLHIADTIFALIVFAFLLYLIYKMIRIMITDIMKYEKFETDVITYFDNAEDAMASYTKEEPEKWLDILIKSRQSVRRRYKNAIKKGTKGKINASCSPTELENAAGLSDDEQMQVLHAAYESIRYDRAK